MAEDDDDEDDLAHFPDVVAEDLRKVELIKLWFSASGGLNGTSAEVPGIGGSLFCNVILQVVQDAASASRSFFM